MWNQQTPSNSGSFCRSEQMPDILNQVFKSPTGLVASAVTPEMIEQEDRIGMGLLSRSRCFLHPPIQPPGPNPFSSLAGSSVL